MQNETLQWSGLTMVVQSLPLSVKFYLYNLDYDRIIAATRAQLDEATFAAACTEGCTLALEQAIPYALEETASTDERSTI